MNNLIEQGTTGLSSNFPYFISALELSVGAQSGRIQTFPRKGTGAGNQVVNVGENWNAELTIPMLSLTLGGIRINGDFTELQLRGLLTMNTNYTGIVEICIMYIPKSEIQYGTSNNVVMKLAGSFVADSLANESNQINLNIQELIPGAGEGFSKDGMLIPLYYNRNTGANVTGSFVGDIFGI